MRTYSYSDLNSSKETWGVSVRNGIAVDWNLGKAGVIFPGHPDHNQTGWLYKGSTGTFKLQIRVLCMKD